jgi:hypothetical protein
VHAKPATIGIWGMLYDTVVTFFLMQVVALMYKNVVLFRRNVVGSLVHVFAPGVMILLFGLIVNSTTSGDLVEPLHPATITTLGSSGAGGELGMPLCQVLDAAGGRYGAGKPMPDAACVSMIYAPANDAGVKRVAEVLAKRHGLKSHIVGAKDALGDVMASVVQAEGVDILGFTDTKRMLQFLNDDGVYGRVGFALRFNDHGLVSRADPTLLDELDVDGVDAPTIAYQIWTNATFDDPDLSEYRFRMGMNNGPATVIQRVVNEAIIGAHTGDDEVALRVGLKPFPRVKGAAEGEAQDNDNYSGGAIVISAEVFAPLFLYIGVSFSCLMTLRHIVHEKETKILDGLRMMGLSEAAYWTSWLIYYAVLMFISTWFVIAAGNAASVPMFVNSDTSLMFWCIYTYFLSMVCFAMFLSTLVPTVGIVVACCELLCVFECLGVVCVLWCCTSIKPCPVVCRHLESR